MPQSITIKHAVLRMEKKFSAIALSQRFPRLDMDGVMPYSCVRLKQLERITAMLKVPRTEIVVVSDQDNVA